MTEQGEGRWPVYLAKPGGTEMYRDDQLASQAGKIPLVVIHLCRVTAEPFSGRGGCGRQRADQPAGYRCRPQGLQCLRSVPGQLTLSACCWLSVCCWCPCVSAAPQVTVYCTAGDIQKPVWRHQTISLAAGQRGLTGTWSSQVSDGGPARHSPRHTNVHP